MLNGNKKINTILFDFDGTLTNSINLFEKIGENGLVRFNKTIKKIQKKQISQIILKILENNTRLARSLLAIKIFYEITQILNLSYLQSLFFVSYCVYKIKKLHSNVPLKPKTLNVLKRLQSKKFRIGLVTMASFNSLKNKQSILKYFQIIVTRENTTQSKPSPEGLLIALKALKSRPNSSVYIGDLPTDIKAAQAIKMKSIVLQSNLLDKKILAKSNPTKICSSLSDAVDWIIKYNMDLE